MVEVSGFVGVRDRDVGCSVRICCHRRSGRFFCHMLIVAAAFYCGGELFKHAVIQRCIFDDELFLCEGLPDRRKEIEI